MSKATSALRITAIFSRKRERGSKRVLRWLQGSKADARAERDARIKALWLRCHTQEQIAEMLNVPRPTVHHQLAEIAQKRQMSEMNNFQALLYADGLCSD